MTFKGENETSDEQCKTVGKAELKLAEVVHYPSNKLHGSVLINSSPIPGSHRYIHLNSNQNVSHFRSHRLYVQDW